VSVTVSTPLLEPGEQVSVVLPHVGGLPATVESTSGSSVKLVLAVPDDRVKRLAGEEVAIEKTTARGVQRFNGTLSVGGDKGELLTITVAGDAERVQRRNFVRIGAVVPIKIISLEKGVTAGETTTLNVSGSGVLVKDKWRLPLGVDVRLEITLEEGAEPIRALGRVVRFSAEDEKGIRIDDMSRADEDRLIKFIRERERAELRLARGL
jgi:c-di-GMP-binding flagellar brake protein YcgR